jgi:hypothetical protein
MKSYLYAAALAAVVATPTMAAEQLTDNQIYDESLQGALQSDFNRIALSRTQAQIVAPSPDEMAEINQKLTVIANQIRRIEERLSAIRTR